jgi:Ca2+/H+ antiporter
MSDFMECIVFLVPTLFQIFMFSDTDSRHIFMDFMECIDIVVFLVYTIAMVMDFTEYPVSMIIQVVLCSAA